MFSVSYHPWYKVLLVPGGEKGETQQPAAACFPRNSTLGLWFPPLAELQLRARGARRGAGRTRSRRTSPRRGRGSIIRRGRTANSPEPGVTHFDQPGLGSLLPLPNETEQQLQNLLLGWERTRSDAALFSCALLPKANPASPSRLGSPQPLQGSQGCCSPVPLSQPGKAEVCKS